MNNYQLTDSLFGLGGDHFPTIPATKTYRPITLLQA